MSSKAMLVIMDGWGLGKTGSADAIQHARTPFVSSLYQKYPNTTLVAMGNAVGLPDGQMGNSEVGHLNLGAGRIVYQELQRINLAIASGEFSRNPHLLDAIRKAKSESRPLHLMGLVSDGGVHSHIRHLEAICDVCKSQGLDRVFIHAFTDGRDTDPHSGKGFIEELHRHIGDTPFRIATISGRYYAMDRDKRWERVALAYNAMVRGEGEKASDPLAILPASYANNVTDEFVKPTVIVDDKGNPIGSIREGDVVICFNFRTDRCREIVQVLSQEDHPDQEMKALKLDLTTLTEYDKSFKNVRVVFETDNLNNTLGEVLAGNGKKQIRIAETEKYPHVTFFFSGGREQPFEGESRILVPSPKVATYDLKPEMSAEEVTAKLLPEIKAGNPDFVCLNYANADMVGHTGVFNAVIKAVETVDDCVRQVVTAGLESGYTIFLTADHGNADFMINADGSPNTQHSLNLVPLFVIGKDFHGTVKPGKLGDIAPSILHVMGLPIPKEMTGEILVSP